MANQPVLHNIRILDFTWVLAGPYATRILADFGAEVIKVQPFMEQEDDNFAHGYYNTWNRNKLGITLNMNKPQGVALVKKLVGISDCLVENFSPRVMSNWGLDYDSLKKIKPELIMLSMSVMGNKGPWRDYVGFGPTVQAFSGMTYLTSFPGEPPSGLGYAYSDHVSGLMAVLALLGALEYRRKTGKGQYIDVSQVEAMSSLMGEAFVKYGINDKSPEPIGNHSANKAPCGIYRCLGDDRWCAIIVSSDDEWKALKLALGNPSWVEDKKFDTVAARLKNVDEMDNLLENWTRERIAEDVMVLLQKHGVAAGVVQDARDLVNDHQLKERDFFVELAGSELGKTVSDATPIKLSEIPADYKQAAPAQGQHNNYVYGELLGIGEKELSDLKQQGVI
ncbi:CaiB/BaiF CoA transferase family protein [Chloroflexota bacterium]